MKKVLEHHSSPWKYLITVLSNAHAAQGHALMMSLQLSRVRFVFWMHWIVYLINYISDVSLGLNVFLNITDKPKLGLGHSREEFDISVPFNAMLWPVKGMASFIFS